MFSIRLKELRADREISQRELANILFVSQQTVAKWETDKATPNPEMLTKISDYFNITTDYLLGREEQKENPTTTNDSEVSDLQDPITAEILEIMKKLSPSGQDLVLSQIRSVADFEHKKDK